MLWSIEYVICTISLSWWINTKCVDIRYLKNKGIFLCPATQEDITLLSRELF